MCRELLDSDARMPLSTDGVESKKTRMNTPSTGELVNKEENETSKKWWGVSSSYIN